MTAKLIKRGTVPPKVKTKQTQPKPAAQTVRGWVKAQPTDRQSEARKRFAALFAAR